MIIQIDTIEKMNFKGVYSIKNIVTNKQYIGSTTMSFKKDWNIM